jgi:hypothetical protein
VRGGSVPLVAALFTARPPSVCSSCMLWLDGCGLAAQLSPTAKHLLPGGRVLAVRLLPAGVYLIMALILLLALAILSAAYAGREVSPHVGQHVQHLSARGRCTSTQPNS